MGLGTVLLVVLILLLLGAIPAWPHSRSWGYFPSGGSGHYRRLAVARAHLIGNNCESVGGNATGRKINRPLFYGRAKSDLP